MEVHDQQQWTHEWFDAWNSHDLDRILSHYTEDAEMISPMIQKLMSEPSGRLSGQAALRTYWGKALALVPDLHFEPVSVCWGVGSVVLTYRGVAGRTVSEVLTLNPAHRIARAHAHYA